MTGWLIAGGILFLLAILPLGVRFRYNEQGFAMKILAGPFKNSGFRFRKRKNLRKIPPKKEKKKPKESEKPKEDSQKGGQLEGFPSPGLRGAGLSGRPAAKTAVRPYQHPCGPGRRGPGGPGYSLWKNLGSRGRTLASCWSGLSSSGGKMWKSPATLPPRNPGGRRRRRDPDPLGRAVCLTVRYGVRGFREYLKIRKSMDKAVQEHE